MANVLDWVKIGDRTNLLFERKAFAVMDLETMKAAYYELYRHGIHVMSIVIGADVGDFEFDDADDYLANGLAIVMVVLDDDQAIYDKAVDILEPAVDAEVIKPLYLMNFVDKEFFIN